MCKSVIARKGNNFISSSFSIRHHQPTENSLINSIRWRAVNHNSNVGGLAAHFANCDWGFAAGEFVYIQNHDLGIIRNGLELISLLLQDDDSVGLSSNWSKITVSNMCNQASPLAPCWLIIKGSIILGHPSPLFPGHIWKWKIIYLWNMQSELWFWWPSKLTWGVSLVQKAICP